MLSILAKPTSGDATIYGYSINSDADKIKEIIDISMQETAIARKLTVEENIEFYAELYGKSKEEIKETKKHIYESFGLEKVKNKKGIKIIWRLAKKTIYCTCSCFKTKDFIFR